LSNPALLIPFKAARSKSRLSPVLGPDARRELAYFLLDGVLRTVCSAGLGRLCYVVSSDAEARDRAKLAGVSFLGEPRDSGVNGAVRYGIGRLKTRDAFMVIPSDLALLRPADIDLALRLWVNDSLVIAPSSLFNGTNLLIFPRRMSPFLSYDDDSFWNHIAAGARLGLRTVVLTQRRLVFDVDTPTDAKELMHLRINTEAAKFLRKSLAK
jgi:2-phospho-L-lactate/phosphoenolpyruvate guanylyltransferase